MKAAYKVIYYVGGQRLGSYKNPDCPRCAAYRAKKAAEMKRYRARRKQAGKRIK